MGLIALFGHRFKWEGGQYEKYWIIGGVFYDPLLLNNVAGQKL